MRRVLKKYFVPHKENDYKPHLLREASILTLASLIIALFVASHYPVINNARFTAEVLPAILVDLANQDRKATNIPDLVVNEKLQQAAQLKANDMLRNGYFAHTSPQGVDPWHWFKQVGYVYAYAGENLAMGFFESTDVNQAWLNSPLHKQNILNQRYTEIGIATSQGIYNGIETTFVVQMFGRPFVKPTVPIAQAQEPTVRPVPTPKVKTVTPEPPTLVTQTTPEPENIVISDMFAMTKNTEVAGIEEIPTVSLVATPRKYTSWFSRLIGSPKNTVQYAYLIIATIILSALFISLFVEIQKQQPKHIILGVAVLTLIFALVYVNQVVAFASVLVI